MVIFFTIEDEFVKQIIDEENLEGSLQEDQNCVYSPIYSVPDQGL